MNGTGQAQQKEDVSSSTRVPNISSTDSDVAVLKAFKVQILMNLNGTLHNHSRRTGERLGSRLECAIPTRVSFTRHAYIRVQIHATLLLAE